MTFYARIFSKKTTPQRRPAESTQRRNSAGGYSFVVDDFTRLDRFLILGADGPTYYASAKQLVLENAECVERCLTADGLRTVQRVVEVSESGRAPKNEPAIFALALASASAEDEVRRAALVAVRRVCRTATHLFQYAETVKQFRGWGRGLRNAVAAWYNHRDAAQLAYQVVKYRQRNGWSHRDLLRLAHPAPKHDAIYRWVVGAGQGERRVVRGDNSVSYRQSDTLPAYIEGFERLQRAGDVNTVCALIDEFRFTHEMIPTQFKTSKQVWERLLSEMPVTATIRNLGVMTSLGLLRDGSSAARTVAARVTDAGILSRARVHPLTLLSALNVYRQGRGHRGQLRWQPSRQVIDALDSAFYRAFAIVAATGKRIMLAMDVSGSMGCGTIAGAPGITPMIGSAAMAMATARSEKDWQAVAFSSKGWTSTKAGGGRYQGWGTAISPLPISPRQRLDDVVRTMQRVDMGCTDCALPMLYAADQKIAVDAFYVFTDNETWAGKVHPHQALEQYRQKMGIGAKLVVVGMTATQFSIAHPQDAGMLDVVGFDSAAPNLMADFTRN